MSKRLRVERGVLLTLGCVLAFLIVAPVVALFIKTPPSVFWAGLFHPLVWPALKLTALTTLTSLLIIVVFGTPLAWSVARAQTRWQRWAETALFLPMVIPPAVSGIALLLAFGRRGLFTSGMGFDDVTIAFTPGAVVLAQIFVSAPFYVQAGVTAFRRLDQEVLLVARTLGTNPIRLFFQIAVPLAATGLCSAGAVAWARSLGEFGATLMFAGNLQGTTQTLPLAIYVASESDMQAAQALSLVLVGVAFVLLFLTRTRAASSDLPERPHA